MRDALVGDQKLVGVVIVQDQGAFRSKDLDAYPHAELWSMGG
jgi:hypothetical protein